LKVINIPNLLTLFRLTLIPLLVVIFYYPNESLLIQDRNLIATLIFLIAAITDWLDGYLARKLMQSSDFGAFLDPVADKLIVITALLLLLELGRVNAVIAIIIIGREFAISSLREWMAKIGKSNGVTVVFIGKFKTTIQMIAIIFLLYYKDIGMLPVVEIGNVLIYCAALLTIVSMFYYLKISIKTLKNID
jgi:cardiolipin synthase